MVAKLSPQPFTLSLRDASKPWRASLPGHLDSETYRSWLTTRLRDPSATLRDDDSGSYHHELQGPIVDIEAEFTISDVSWFAAEETLFVFYELEALAGLNESSAVEIKFTTDNLTVDWTPLDGFNHVHTHVSVNCGPSKLCGSASISVNQEPRNIGLRLRYHKDGELTRLAVPLSTSSTIRVRIEVEAC